MPSLFTLTCMSNGVLHFHIARSRCGCIRHVICDDVLSHATSWFKPDLHMFRASRQQSDTAADVMTNLPACVTALVMCDVYEIDAVPDCCTGVVAIALARAAADVVATDLPHVTSLTCENVAVNCGSPLHRCQVCERVHPLTALDESKKVNVVLFWRL